MTGQPSTTRRTRGSTRAITVSALAIVLVAFLSVWHVQAPPRDSNEYELRTAQSAGALRSQVVSAHAWANLVADGRATRQAATVGIEDAEKAAQSSTSQQAAWDVPRERLVPLRRELLALGDEATGILAQMRLAAHDEDWATVREVSRDLPPLADELTRLERKARS